MPIEARPDMVGKTIVVDDAPAIIVAAIKEHYKVERMDGAMAWIRADAVHRKVQVSVALANSADDIISAYQRGEMDAQLSRQRRLQCAMEDVRRMQAGLDPSPLTDEDREHILANLRSRPPMQVDPETTAKVSARLTGKEASHRQRYSAGVNAEVVRLMDRARLGK